MTPVQPAEQGPPPVPASEADLDFKRQPMVGWLDPAQLVTTAIETYQTSSVVKLFDVRTMESLLSSEPLFHYADQSDLWFDYVADLGDGFDSTYTVAYCLAQSELGKGTTTFSAGAPATDLPRGRVLIMGGDEVYPVAAADNYRNRLAGPYRAALPYSKEPSDLFAIPGNHDWYDGLVSFINQFCQPRWIGGWQTKQTRSYFALELPQRWWLWATDIQLARDIDTPQMAFFKKASELLQRGDRVVLCTAEPSWVQLALGSPRPYEGLSFIERNLIEPRGAELLLTLTGDRHNYARYRKAPTGGEPERHKINAGGGGAFLSGTHDLPPAIDLPKGDRATEKFELTQAYPDAAASRRTTWRALGIVLTNKGFGALVAALYLAYAWLLQSASRGDLVVWPRNQRPPLTTSDGLLGWLRDAGASFVDVAASGGIGAIASSYLSVLRSPEVGIPTAAFLTALVIFAFVSRRRADKGQIGSVIAGLLHGVTHVMVNVALVALVVRLIVSPTSALKLALFLGVMVVLGSIAGCAIMGVYLMVTNAVLGLHDQEVFSVQANPNYKNFLRIHIDRAGTLRIYPIGIDKAKKWKLRTDKTGEGSWFVSKDDTPVELRMIEPVITIGAAVAPPAGSGVSASSTALPIREV